MKPMTLPAARFVTIALRIGCVAALIAGCEDTAAPDPAASATGTLRVTVSTSGDVQEIPNGYALRLARPGDPVWISIFSGELPANGTVDISGLVPGAYRATLADVASNCFVDGVTRRPNVTPNSVVSIEFRSECVQTGFLRFMTVTSGPDPDPDGYLIGVEGLGRPFGVPIATDGTVLSPRIPTGNRRIALSDVTVNCTVAGGPQRDVLAPGRDTLTVAFHIDCSIASLLAFVLPLDTAAVNTAIYTGKSNGTGATRLSGSPGTPDSEPAWSPGGSRIAFTRVLDGNADIWVMNADGSGAVRLTTSPEPDRSPDWSPDGSRIVFVSSRDDPAIPDIGDIYAMNADGSAPIRLTRHPALDADPAWSPDGHTIAFTSLRDSISEIYTIDVDGSALRRLTFNVARNRHPAWSPDGRTLAFARDECDQYGLCYPTIHTMHADGSNVSTAGTIGYQPVWSPDGRFIAYTLLACIFRGFYSYGNVGCTESGVWIGDSLGRNAIRVADYAATHPSWRR